jgi:hypothetical protein
VNRTRGDLISKKAGKMASGAAVRFGFESVEAELMAVGREIVVEAEEMADDRVLVLQEAVVCDSFRAGAVGGERDRY